MLGLLLLADEAGLDIDFSSILAFVVNVDPVLEECGLLDRCY